MKFCPNHLCIFVASVELCTNTSHYFFIPSLSSSFSPFVAVWFKVWLLNSLIVNSGVRKRYNSTRVPFFKGRIWLSDFSNTGHNTLNEYKSWKNVIMIYRNIQDWPTILWRFTWLGWDENWRKRRGLATHVDKWVISLKIVQKEKSSRSIWMSKGDHRMEERSPQKRTMWGKQN